MKTADLVDNTPRMQPQVVARQEKPPSFMEVRSPPSACKLTPPLPRSETDLEVQKPPTRGASYGDTGEAPIVTNWLEAPPVRRDRPLVSKPPWLVTALPKTPYGDAKEAPFVTNWLEVPPVRRDRPRVGKPPWLVTTPPERCSRQTPAYLKDLPCAIQDAVKCSTRYRTGRMVKRGSCDPYGNTNFCLGGISKRIHASEVISPNHVSQPRCSLFSHIDTVTSGRT